MNGNISLMCNVMVHMPFYGLFGDQGKGNVCFRTFFSPCGCRKCFSVTSVQFHLQVIGAPEVNGRTDHSLGNFRAAPQCE